MRRLLLHFALHSPQVRVSPECILGLLAVVAPTSIPQRRCGVFTDCRSQAKRKDNAGRAPRLMTAPMQPFPAPFSSSTRGSMLYVPTRS